MRVQSGYVDNPDVFVAWEDEYLTRMLIGSISREEIAGGDSPFIKIAAEEGAEGFRHLAGFLGLNPLKDKQTEPSENGNDEFS